MQELHVNEQGFWILVYTDEIAAVVSEQLTTIENQNHDQTSKFAIKNRLNKLLEVKTFDHNLIDISSHFTVITEKAITAYLVLIQEYSTYHLTNSDLHMTTISKYLANTGLTDLQNNLSELSKS